MTPLTNPDQPTLRLHDGYKRTREHLQSLVTRLQQMLNAAGVTVKVDGRFGRDTELAVITYQRDRGLEPDGIVGPATWHALVGAPAELMPTYPTTYAAESPGLRRDLIFAEKHRDVIEQVARETELAPALVAAIGSRESGWGRLLRPIGPTGKGDHGHGRGLVQIDDRFHEFARSGKWGIPLENVRYGMNLLLQYRRELAKTTGLEGLALTRAALAAYNSGVGNVRKAVRAGRDVDHFTTGRDYSRDVLSRAGWFERKGW